MILGHGKSENRFRINLKYLLYKRIGKVCAYQTNLQCQTPHMRDLATFVILDLSKSRLTLPICMIVTSG